MEELRLELPLYNDKEKPSTDKEEGFFIIDYSVSFDVDAT
jgi:hypothetical protein